MLLHTLLPFYLITRFHSSLLQGFWTAGKQKWLIFNSWCVLKMKLGSVRCLSIPQDLMVEEGCESRKALAVTRRWPDLGAGGWLLGYPIRKAASQAWGLSVALGVHTLQGADLWKAWDFHWTVPHGRQCLRGALTFPDALDAATDPRHLVKMVWSHLHRVGQRWHQSE